jgi:GAF domain-containing protein
MNSTSRDVVSYLAESFNGSVRQLPRMGLGGEEVAARLQASNQSLSNALAAAEGMVSHAMKLQEVTAALSQAQTEDEVADVVLGKGLGVIDAVRGLLARVDGERFQIIRALGYRREDEAQMLALTLDDEAPLTAAAKSDQPLCIASPAEHLARFPILYRRLGVAPPQASVCVPLRHGREIVGVLGMFFTDSSAFGVAKQAFTLLLAQAVADALARARSYDTERIARRGAETSAQARADVLGIVAHDLRSPLSAIASSSEFLLEYDDLPTAQRRKMLEIMQRSARRMNRLIGDLLDATQLQAGRLSLDLSVIDACTKCQGGVGMAEIVESYTPKAKAFHSSVKRLREQVWMDRCSIFVCEH